ncbi:MAG TPA: hypothetical protein VHP30_01310 [Ignavibacteriales bacterium]|nr:hypothetical protein [Ignavibacteriales bacterium]
MKILIYSFISLLFFSYNLQSQSYYSDDIQKNEYRRINIPTEGAQDSVIISLADSDIFSAVEIAYLNENSIYIGPVSYLNLADPNLSICIRKKLYKNNKYIVVQLIAREAGRFVISIYRF